MPKPCGQNAKVGLLYTTCHDNRYADILPPATLLYLLKYDPSLILDDLHDTMDVGPVSLDDAKDRMAYLMQSETVARWMGGPLPSTLIINGQDAVPSPSPATSLFSAMLLRALDRSQHSPVISWFCDQRVHGSVAQMLLSLIGQIVYRFSDDVDPPAISQAGHLNNVGDLTHFLLLCLEAQLERSAVYCIIDAIATYEDRRRSKDLCYAIRKLAGLTRASGGRRTRYPFKLLVSDPVGALDVSAALRPTNAVVLDLPDYVEGAMYELNELDVLEHTKRCLTLEGE